MVRIAEGCLKSFDLGAVDCRQIGMQERLVLGCLSKRVRQSLLLGFQIFELGIDRFGVGAFEYRVDQRRLIWRSTRSMALRTPAFAADAVDRCPLTSAMNSASHPGQALYSDGEEAIAKAIETEPDVALLDYSLPLLNGLEVTRQIRARLPRTEVLIFTMYESELAIEEALQAGARGYLLKYDANRYLIEAIASVAAHRPFFTSKVTETLLKGFLNRPDQPTSTLTSRERGVVQLIAEGHSNKQIGHLLNIGVKTVETHRAAVMRKLNFSSPADLVRYAVRNQIIEA